MTLSPVGDHPRTVRWPQAIGLGLLLLASGAAGVIAGGFIAPSTPTSPPATALRQSAAPARPAAEVPRPAATVAPAEQIASPPDPPTTATTTICSTASAPVRKTRSDNAEQVTEALFGHELEVNERRDGWLRVRVVEQGYPGWIRESAATEVSAGQREHTRVVAVDDTRPAASGTSVSPSGWPEVLHVGSVVMMADGIGRGLAEAHGPDSDVAWLPTGHLGPRLDADGIKVGGMRVVAVARSFMDTRYEWGGMTGEGIDCSGLVWVSHFACGYTLPRDSGPQSLAGQAVSRDDLQAGDCLFFGKSDHVDHVGIYVGNGRFIHATPPRVTISRLDASPYSQRFIRARRFTHNPTRAAASVVVVDTDRASGNRSPATIAEAIRSQVPVQCPVVSYRGLTPSQIRSLDAVALVLSGQSTPWWNYSASELDAVAGVLQTVDLPVLGICGGHQLLALAFGGTVAPIDGPQRGETYADCRREKGWTTLQVALDDPLLTGLGPSIEVWENHCEEVKTLPPGFVALAEGSLSRHQAMRHPTRALWGTQFHPEVDGESGDGREILRGFLRAAQVTGHVAQRR
jgi:GMP synthase-like glutamine amidotransferase